MQIFLEPSNLSHVKKALDYNLIDGINLYSNLTYQNQSDLEKAILEITKIVRGPVNIPISGLTADVILEEAKKKLKFGPNTVLKIKTTLEGLKATKTFSAQSIPVNMTSILSPAQAAIAARSGAEFVTISLQKAHEAGCNISELLGDTVQIFEQQSFRTRVIASEIVDVKTTAIAIKSGVDIISVSYNLLTDLVQNPI